MFKIFASVFNEHTRLYRDIWRLHEGLVKLNIKLGITVANKCRNWVSSRHKFNGVSFHILTKLSLCVSKYLL